MRKAQNDERLRREREAILLFLQESPAPVSTGRVAHVMSMSREVARRHLTALNDAALVDRSVVPRLGIFQHVWGAKTPKSKLPLTHRSE
jgi:predicted ArsR family transcriptional regulator